jgi:rod shape determining protein RodA
MVLQEKRFFQHFDWLLIVAVGLLVTLGVILIHNTTAGTEGFDTTNLLQDFTFRQILYAVVGFGALFFLSALDYRIYAQLRWLIYLVIIGLLVTVFIIGQITRGAQRWIDLSVFQLQPSEVSKLLVVLVLAKFLADNELQISQWRPVLLSLVLIGIPIGLVYFEPDLGTALVFAFIWGIMVMAAGLTWKQLAVIVAVVVVLAPLVWFNLQPYQRERVTTFLNPNADPLGAGYNVTQARIATGSGGLWGRGIGYGTQSQLRFLRIRHTDFIFSVIGEELGFWGGVFFFVLFALILLRMLRAASIARSTFGRLVAIGFAAALFFQTFVNLGMNLGLVPVTGIPLPFVSSGGSSLVTYLMMVGIIESILAREKAMSMRTKPKRV